MLINRRQYKERRKGKLWRNRIARVLLFLLALAIIFLARFAAQSTKQTNQMLTDISNCKNGVYRDFVMQDRGACERHGEMIIILKKDYDRTLIRKIADVSIAGAGDDTVQGKYKK